MHLATCRTGKVYILYDADSVCDAKLAPQIGPQLFDSAHWSREGRVVGEAPGRGSSLFLDAGPEEWVLRPYRRGGLVAKWNETRYPWTGLERTRAFRELRLTANLYERGLPVPRPVAAGVTRFGLTYGAALITARIPGARSLADRLLEHAATGTLLKRVGATVARFHAAGLDHVDLNARNLLVDARDKVWLIDLDRCRLREPGSWQATNLDRLQRSLVKFHSAAAMTAIRRGYASPGAN
ncbi:3-deoxy-D-manno-octulosonic acid kinase [Billgrantia endophytica]|uniref:3-deoxy-D-manno-octulosonic acid kinase n=1 Tax=Billgrantia endophytica TaxID=2033802 RepID=A0A2N7U2L6_9GAMM|nr:3-deoxy-D-manno-octulosonic acid kinase [Halomonas endophytica]PMR74681.1 3-deoxy-D-manno-octulosonic acid kinase [Halomonas endophytica]